MENKDLGNMLKSEQIRTDMIEHPAIRDVFEEASKYFKCGEVVGNPYMDHHRDYHTDRISWWSGGHVDYHTNM